MKVLFPMIVFTLLTGCANQQASMSLDEEPLSSSKVPDRNRAVTLAPVQSVALHTPPQRINPSQNVASTSITQSSSTARNNSTSATPDTGKPDQRIAPAPPTGSDRQQTDQSKTPTTGECQGGDGEEGGAGQSSSPGSSQSGLASFAATSSTGSSSGETADAGLKTVSAASSSNNKAPASAEQGSIDTQVPSAQDAAALGSAMPAATSVQGLLGPASTRSPEGDANQSDPSLDSKKQSGSLSDAQGWKTAPVAMPTGQPSSPKSTPDQQADVNSPEAEIGHGTGPSGRSAGQASGASAGGGGHSGNQKAATGGGATEDRTSDASIGDGVTGANSLPNDEAPSRPSLTLRRLAQTMSSQDHDDAHALPEIDEGHMDPSRLGIAEEVLSDHAATAPIRGVWRLVESGPDDFLPTGSQERFIGIDPDRGEIVTLLSWNDGEVVLMAEYAADISQRVAVIQETQDRASRLPEPGQLLPGGVRLTSTTMPGPWTLNWRRAGTSLRIGESLYVAEDPAIIDNLMRGEVFLPTQPLRPTAQLGPAPIIEKSQEATSVDFFGVQSEGRWVCYVIDISGSMAGDKLERLKQELRESISNLPPGVSFALVFFSSDAQVIADGWTRSHSVIASSILRKVRQVGAGGGTDPAEAFRWAFGALEPAPDTIYFMTDGTVATADLPGLLRNLNASRPRARIHTIGFGADADISLLQMIAQQHGGSFAVVP
ncbi:MAG: VWA domain-containing protein [Phycisphaerales bacterium]|nr:VWA domain-containing protein [Phycisphaerales bacterium]